MRDWARISVVIPAYNEEASIRQVISAIPRWVDEIVVVDNGSTDGTAKASLDSGARVVFESRRGYGAACLAGIAALDDPDIVVFVDGDFSDHPEDMGALVDPIVNDRADLVAGSRILGKREPGALTPQARFGNRLACGLIRLFWGARYTDLGPFRAIRATTLEALGMRDRAYGWMVEMQIKATLREARVIEVEARYRRRIGRSKISGTFKGVVGAGVKILWTIFRAALRGLPGDSTSAGERIVVFTRFPEAGKTKTRLIPALGPEGAAELHRQMTEHALSRVFELRKNRAVSVEIRYAGGSRPKMQEWLGTGAILRRQPEGDQGARMAGALRDAFIEGAERVLIVGTDCPGITAGLLQEALEALASSDLVLGPSLDGGYYLIGMRRFLPELFSDIQWGAREVMERTLSRCSRLGIVPARLKILGDVDRPEDLYLWERANRDTSI